MLGFTLPTNPHTRTLTRSTPANCLLHTYPELALLTINAQVQLAACLQATENCIAVMQRELAARAAKAASMTATSPPRTAPVASVRGNSYLEPVKLVTRAGASARSRGPARQGLQQEQAQQPAQPQLYDMNGRRLPGPPPPPKAAQPQPSDEDDSSDESYSSGSSMDARDDEFEVLE